MDPGEKSEQVGLENSLAQCDRTSHHSEKVKKNLVTRLKKFEGQVRGIKRLIYN